MPVRAQARALERVDGDVDLRRRAVADLARRCRASGPRPSRPRRSRRRRPSRRCRSTCAHGVDGGLVGGLLVAAADQRAAGQRGGLGHAHELEREVAIRLATAPSAQRTPGGLRTRSVSDARMAPRRRIIRIVPSSATNQPSCRPIAAARLARAVDEAGVERSGRRRRSRRPRSSRRAATTARGRGAMIQARISGATARGEQQPAHDRMHLPGAEVAARAVDHARSGCPTVPYQGRNSATASSSPPATAVHSERLTRLNRAHRGGPELPMPVRSL